MFVNRIESRLGPCPRLSGIVSESTLKYYCSETEFNIWFSGQRVDPATNSPFVWGVLQADNTTYVGTPLAYTNWASAQPDFAG